MKMGAPVFRYIFIALLLFVVVLVQGMSSLSWFGVRPNIVFAALIALSFTLTEFSVYALVVLIVTVLAGSGYRFFFDELVFTLILLVLFFVRGRIPTHRIVASMLMGALGTLAFYIAVDPYFITRDTIAVSLEMLYNAIITALFFTVFRRIFSHEKTSLTSI